MSFQFQNDYVLHVHVVMYYIIRSCLKTVLPTKLNVLFGIIFYKRKLFSAKSFFSQSNKALLSLTKSMCCLIQK